MVSMVTLLTFEMSFTCCLWPRCDQWEAAPPHVQHGDGAHGAGSQGPHGVGVSRQLQLHLRHAPRARQTHVQGQCTFPEPRSWWGHVSAKFSALSSGWFPVSVINSRSVPSSSAVFGFGHYPFQNRAWRLNWPRIWEIGSLVASRVKPMTFKIGTCRFLAWRLVVKVLNLWS